MPRIHHTAYKAFRYRNGRLCFLFRGHEGSLVVPLGTWLTAKAKTVRDGKGHPYRAGFHCMRDEESRTRFDRLTKGKYVFLKIRVRDARPKPHSRTGIWLARQIRVPICALLGCGHAPATESH